MWDIYSFRVDLERFLVICLSFFFFFGLYAYIGPIGPAYRAAGVKLNSIFRALNSKFLAKNAIFGKLGVDLGGYVPISSRFGKKFPILPIIGFKILDLRGGMPPPPRE
jgi:hypothetical protein